MSPTTMENLALRRALSHARLRENDVANSLNVDPKTVQRWLAGRRPQPAHRWALAELVGVHEFDLWPELGGAPPIDPEVVAVYPHRSSVPREIWRALFAGAGERIDVLVYSGLFLAEDVDLMDLLATKAAEGVTVRILLGDPDCPAVDERGRSEGIDGAMAAKVRNALVLHRALLAPHGGQIRLHSTVLYNSVYRADDEILVNQHVYGIGAAQAPVMRLQRREGGAIFAAHADAVERTWIAAVPPA
jgi:hypothetical protein